ncbi:AAA family ATPase [Luteolibacter luteus]|uniref:AAA domain-containing protein n=1 Tax=Luteolibacter luteus TaxID=2728835 RepID=A0A858RRS4_9BACT|nr:AAA family ATPase [Luteolibacter luteus]QJE98830.1 AAA domain-containing protein [Luteolibacter luteus]
MNTRDQILDLKQRIATSIIGQEQVIERLIIALLTNGNVLMEGLPGLAKTRAIKTLAMHLESQFSRIQFTPDLLPADVTGSEIYFEEGGKGQFKFQEGPIFGNLVLADEINRSPAKVQAALLEAMEERQVTVAGTTHKLPELFMVLATQNPIEQEGTYPLPEAQMDRFLMHIFIKQPADEDELKVLKLVRGEEASGGMKRDEAPIPQSVVFDARKEVAAVATTDAVDRYFVAIISATRNAGRYDKDLGRWIHVGASPRGTLALDRASRARAWLQGRDHVIPEDVQAVAADCLRHRIIPSYDASAEGRSNDELLDALMKKVAVP